nr:MAG TPA: hypothetical protein [Caudoviricetes sp.]
MRYIRKKTFRTFYKLSKSVLACASQPSLFTPPINLQIEINVNVNFNIYAGDRFDFSVHGAFSFRIFFIRIPFGAKGKQINIFSHVCASFLIISSLLDVKKLILKADARFTINHIDTQDAFSVKKTSHSYPLLSLSSHAIAIAVSVAAGAQAADRGHAGAALKNAGNLRHDLDGLGLLVVAALNGLAVAVLVFVLRVVHPDDTGGFALSGLHCCTLGSFDGSFGSSSGFFGNGLCHVPCFFQSAGKDHFGPMPGLRIPEDSPCVVHDVVQIILFHCSFLRFVFLTVI